jgi:hypothetical protein
MDEKTERRTMDRQGCNCEVNWSYFNKQGYMKGQVRNCCQEGSYIETAKPISPGSTVLLRVLQCKDFMAEHPTDIRFNAVRHQIKWQF